MILYHKEQTINKIKNLMIEENFEYTAKLFDKKEKERLTVIKEEAYKKRKVKTDAPVQQISEKKEEKQYNPYLAELERSHK